MTATQQDFELRQGENLFVRFTIELSDGSGALDLDLVSSFTWRVTEAGDESLVFSKTGSGSGITVDDADAGICTVVIETADTNLSPGYYDHQLRIVGTDTSGDDFDKIAAEGKMHIKDSYFVADS